MKSLGALLLIFGVVSSILYFMNYNLRILSWMNDMDETQQWLIRGGLIVVGAVIWILGNKKQKAA